MIMTRLIKFYNFLNPILEAKERKELITHYNDWVNSQTKSIINGDYCDSQNEYRPDKPHHILTANNHGLQLKPPDIWKVPLTSKQHAEHHQSGKYQDIFIAKLPELHDLFIEETSLRNLRVWVVTQKSYERKGK